MSKRHAEQASLNQLQLEIEKLLEDKARAEARLEALERDHAEDLNAQMPALPAPAHPEMLSVSEDPGVVSGREEAAVNFGAASHSSLSVEEDLQMENILTVPGRDHERNPTPMSELNAFHTTAPLKPRSTVELATVVSNWKSDSICSAEIDSPLQRRDIEATRTGRPTVVHHSEAQAAISSSRLQSRSESEMGKFPYRSASHEPETADFMVKLHDDYTACLRQLQAFQSQLEQALQNMYIPTVGIPAVKPDLDMPSRREMIDAVHVAARKTSDCLDQRILKTSVKRGSSHEAQEEARAKRGERSMRRLFDTNADLYDHNTLVEDEEQPISVHPLVNLSSNPTEEKETLIDLDMGAAGLDSQPTFNFDFSDALRLKAARPSRLPSTTPNDDDNEDHNEFYDGPDKDTRRASKDWQFPLSTMPADNPSRRTQDWTFSMAQPQAANSNVQEWSFATTQGSSREDSNHQISDETSPTAEAVANKPNAKPDFPFFLDETPGQINDFLHSSDTQGGSWTQGYNRRMDAHTRQQLLDGLLTSTVASGSSRSSSASQLNASDPIRNTASEIESDITRIVDQENLPTVNDLLRRWTNLEVPAS
ncbi:unnamed protein product [Aureobasidium mustum]|uniref:Uncharacterized protein n=1 Tax=Aureobasidium mustum TaxID=2773714 RepID=A0A9N8JSP4_9PEZI|nr:unnamed protein product [Aureobasidium mustum]